MRIRMLRTQSGSANEAGSVAKLYMEGGVYDAPSSIPAGVACVFLDLGSAERVADAGPPETKPAAPPELMAKRPEQEIDAAAPRRRGRPRRR